METLINVLDLLALLALVVLLLRAVGTFGSAALSALVGFFVILFAIVSLGAFTSEPSVGTRVIFLIALFVIVPVALSSGKRTSRPN